MLTADVLISFPEHRSTLMDMGAEITKNLDIPIDYIAGGETAGIPYAAFIAERLNKPMLYVRKKPKGFGKMAQIEGHLDTSNPCEVLLVEDLQTEGGSKKVFIDVLRNAGASINHTFVIFHYGIHPQSLRNMEDWSVKLHCLTDWWHVLEAAKSDNSFETETLNAVESYLHNPGEWKAA